MHQTTVKPDVPRCDRPGISSSVMMDGSPGDGKTIASYEYNVEVTRKVSLIVAQGCDGGRELGRPSSLETMGDKEDGHGTDAIMTMSNC
jgi:fructose-bisphosphate aldolase class II